MTRKTRLRRSLVLALTVAVALPLALTASIAIAPAPSLTDAAWTDAEFASGTLTAATLQPPKITSCVPRLGLLGLNLTNLHPTATLTWNVNAIAGNAAPAGYKFYFSLSGPLLLLPLGHAGISDFEALDGVHTTIFSAELLGSLLGGEAKIGVATTLGEWTSPIAVWNWNWWLLGTTCTEAI